MVAALSFMIELCFVSRGGALKSGGDTSAQADMFDPWPEPAHRGCFQPESCELRQLRSAKRPAMGIQPTACLRYIGKVLPGTLAVFEKRSTAPARARVAHGTAKLVERRHLDVLITTFCSTDLAAVFA